MTIPSSDPIEIVPLHVEEISVDRRKVERDVRINIQTVSHEHLVDEPLAHETVEIERVQLDRPVDAIPPTRQEGDLTIISVVEEVLVVERRLRLKEEIRLRRVRTTERHRETVTLREQQAVVERGQPGEVKRGARSEPAPIPKPQVIRNEDE